LSNCNLALGKNFNFKAPLNMEGQLLMKPILMAMKIITTAMELLKGMKTATVRQATVTRFSIPIQKRLASSVNKTLYMVVSYIRDGAITVDKAKEDTDKYLNTWIFTEMWILMQLMAL
jgi:hypothetical protein